jgi:hypothetical protein
MSAVTELQSRRVKEAEAAAEACAEELERLREVRATTQAALASAEERAVAAEQRIAAADRLEGAVALGEVPADEAEAERRDAVAERELAGRDVQRATAAIEELTRRIGDAERDLHVASIAAATAFCDVANDYVTVYLARFEELLEEALAHIGKVEDARATLDARKAEHLRRRNDADESGHFIDDPEQLESYDGDEPTWRPDGWERLVEFVKAGPRRPRAQAEAHAAQVAEAAAQRRTEKIDQLAGYFADYGWDAESSRLAGLTPEEVERVRVRTNEIREWRKRDYEQRREELATGPDALDTSGMYMGTSAARTRSELP